MIGYFARRLRLIEDAEMTAVELRAAYGEHAERLCEELQGSYDTPASRRRLADVRRALRWTPTGMRAASAGHERAP